MHYTITDNENKLIFSFESDEEISEKPIIHKNYRMYVTDFYPMFTVEDDDVYYYGNVRHLKLIGGGNDW